MNNKSRYQAFINTPTLWLGNELGIEQFETKEKLAPKHIQSPKHSVFGKQAEHYFAEYISLHPNYEIVAQNIQIIDLSLIHI